MLLGLHLSPGMHRSAYTARHAPPYEDRGLASAAGTARALTTGYKRQKMKRGTKRAKKATADEATSSATAEVCITFDFCFHAPGRQE